MVPGFGVSAECQSIGTIGKKQRAVERSRGLVIFFTNRNILHTLKKEPLNIMLLHTSRIMDGP